eukprot:Gb_17298 [translate_table: standard]
MDGSIDVYNFPLLNIIVSLTLGPYFFSVIDYLGKEKNIIFWRDALSDAIKEVGASNIIQVIIDATLVCKYVKFLVQNKYRHIF